MNAQLKRIPPISWARNLFAREQQFQRRWTTSNHKYVSIEDAKRFSELSKSKSAKAKLEIEKLLVERALSLMNVVSDRALVEKISRALVKMTNRKNQRREIKMEIGDDPEYQRQKDKFSEMFRDQDGFDIFHNSRIIILRELERKARQLKVNQP